MGTTKQCPHARLKKFDIAIDSLNAQRRRTATRLKDGRSPHPASPKTQAGDAGFSSPTPFTPNSHVRARRGTRTALGSAKPAAEPKTPAKKGGQTGRKLSVGIQRRASSGRSEELSSDSTSVQSPLSTRDYSWLSIDDEGPSSLDRDTLFLCSFDSPVSQDSGIVDDADLGSTAQEHVPDSVKQGVICGRSMQLCTRRPSTHDGGAYRTDSVHSNRSMPCVTSVGSNYSVSTESHTRRLSGSLCLSSKQHHALVLGGRSLSCSPGRRGPLRAAQHEKRTASCKFQFPHKVQFGAVLGNDHLDIRPKRCIWCPYKQSETAS